MSRAIVRRGQDYRIKRQGIDSGDLLINCEFRDGSLIDISGVLSKLSD